MTTTGNALNDESGQCAKRKIARHARRGVLALGASLLLAVSALHVCDYFYPFPVQRIQDRLAVGSAMLRAADRSLVAWRVDKDENRRLRVTLGNVSPHIVAATIAVEDRRFHSHRGVDPLAVARAFWQNLTSGRRVSGASTISMQTVRLLWQRPRTMKTKIMEAFRAWQLERAVGKNGILEIYLNLAPYGGNVVGVEAAAEFYFGKSARQVNLAEACLLAGLPQSPTRLNPLRFPDAARRRRNFVALRLLEDGKIDAEKARRVWSEDMSPAPREQALDVGHFAEYALHSVRPDEKELTTTLDPGLQSVVSRLARRQAESLSFRGVAGPAVVVLSLADSTVLAYVGNASPEGEPARLVDGVLARRQPGSLMKPFIFALLASKGRLAPSSRVYDIPTTWNGYSPKNMDREWRGAMSASDALRQSRNVTAVSQLRSLGTSVFAEFMASVGLEPGRADRYGLTLALGGKEQRLIDVANAYAALGRLGIWKPVRVSRSGAGREGRRILSAEAAWLTLSALAPPNESRAPKQVWKTGTSWNQLDAWAVAMSPDHVVGVWCGRTGRGGSGWVAGADDALPLALETLDAAEARNGTGRKWPPPAGIEFRPVCRESGLPPGWLCDETIVSPMLAGMPVAACVHAAPKAMKERAAGGAETGGANGRKRVPRIVSPTDGAVYVRMAGANNVMPLVAETAAGGELRWFLNGRALGGTASGEAYDWAMTPGSHRLSVSDADGGSAIAVVLVTDE